MKRQDAIELARKVRDLGTPPPDAPACIGALIALLAIAEENASMKRTIQHLEKQVHAYEEQWVDDNV